MKTVVSSKFIIPAVVAALAFFMLQSCGKGTPLVGSPSAWNFSISADSPRYYLGDTLKFQSTAPDNSVFMWSFGDGGSSSRSRPAYVYYSIPYDAQGHMISDTVTLVVNNDIYHSVVKTIKILPPVPRLSRSWAWQGGFLKKFGHCCPSITDHPLNDTIFSISGVDDSTISVWSAGLQYHADSNYFTNARPSIIHNETYVKYTADTLFFSRNSGDDSGGYTVSYYHVF